MSEKRFWFVIDKGKLEYVQDLVTGEKITVTDLEDLLNSLSEENEQLKMRLLNCEQKKNDNGGFQVWEVPPIPQGKRISFTTNNDGGGE